MQRVPRSCLACGAPRIRVARRAHTVQPAPKALERAQRQRRSSTVAKAQPQPQPPPAAEQAPPLAWVSAAALVAGNTVGAGILALPEVTSAAGVVPSLTAILGAWAYSVLTGQMLAEVSVAAQRNVAPGAPPPSFVSLAERTLGTAGGFAAVALQFFLHYVLQVAYTARGGNITARFLHLPSPAGAVLFTSVLVLLCRAGDSRPAILDAGNAMLLTFLLISFGGLMAEVVPQVQPELMLTAHWAAVPAAIPVIALSFVYHNAIPFTTRSCANDGPAIDRALIAGTGGPLALYVVLELAVLGSSSATSFTGMDPQARGVDFVDVFALCAVATSYLGFHISLVDMLLDTQAAATLRRTIRDESSVRSLALAAAALPPCAASILEPGVFIQALEVAGLYGGMVLCGILPGVMALVQRRERVLDNTATAAYSAPGGDVAALAVIALGMAVVFGDLAGLFH
jgi:tyrosine-specific transport protein